MKNKEKFTEPWKEFAKNWQRITSPGRPTSGEIKICEKFLQPILKRKSAQVLVIGATPEIRDLLTKYENVQTTLVDINLEVILAMTDLMKRKNNEETWIKSDWLKVPLRKNYFDAVLGDLVLPNLPFESWTKLLCKIKILLKPSGFFITRTDGYKCNHQPVNTTELFEIFMNWPADLKTANALWETGVFFMSGCKNSSHKVIDFWRKLKKYYRGNNPDPHIKKILKIGHRLYPLDKIWFNLTEKNLHILLNRYFKIENREFDPKIAMPKEYKDWIYIYKLKPKK